MTNIASPSGPGQHGTPFPPDAAHTPWLRVAQRLAGPGMGWHFTPRIGQEVLVGFLCNDIDQPIVLGALYNGQGEAGVMPTPGGKAAGSSTSSGKAAGSQPGGKSADSASSSGRARGCAAASHSAATDAHAPDASTDHRAAAQ
ncbi:MAG: phage baseplate assembly protein V, partial [Dechloromonas sp.]|nr:phage baseplate assembly protein V [Dechloromonas sp.]